MTVPESSIFCTEIKRNIHTSEESKTHQVDKENNYFVSNMVISQPKKNYPVDNILSSKGDDPKDIHKDKALLYLKRKAFVRIRF